MNKFVLMLILLSGIPVTAQIERIEPPNWWVGFKETNLQLMIKGKNISSMNPEIDYPAVSIENVHRGTSPNYLFIDLRIESNAKPGSFTIVFEAKGEKRIKYEYELKERLRLAETYKGFDSSDVIYLITPDRFANADPENDIVKGLKESKIDRKDDYARHGGDIKGITAHLDYINDMGFTAIWSCPLLSNDMPRTSYHGYAITNFYEIDPRFGSLDDYKDLSAKARENGIKIIMDQVVNHCGSEHWWMKDLPFPDWINYQQNFEEGRKTSYSNHRRTINQDLYAAHIDAEEMSDGWFDKTMPDLNQRNPFMAKYLIQNSIWWVETAQLGGIRQDTYPYSDKEFLANWAGSIMKEYPNFSIVGEEWSYNPLLVGYWQQGAHNRDGYESNLRSSMDFPMQKIITDALKEEESWSDGLVKIYEGLANDFHYASPKDIMIFPDNHDMDRIHTQLDKDPVMTQMALALILTLPRIPQIYYGTEILMENSDKPGDHGLIRTDFPGGWANDALNAFTGKGLTEDQIAMQKTLRSILHFRKNSEAIHKGKTIHFAPENGVYIIIRSYKEEVVVLIINKNEKPFDLDLSRFSELNLEGKVFKNVINNESLIWENQISLKTKGALILSSKK